MTSFEICSFEAFVSEATPQAGSLEEAASAQEILIQQIESYLSRLSTALCTDMLTLENLTVDTFLQLTDTPASYVGQGLRVLRVDAAETGIEFVQLIHSSLLGLGADDHLQYLLLAGRAGGQSAFGGTGVGETLALRGSTDAALGDILINSPVTFGDVSAGDSVVQRWLPTFTTGGGFIGGFIQTSATVTYDNSLFIWALLLENSTFRAAVAPGFAAFTLFNALAIIENSGNFNLVQALVLNVGVTHARTTAGTSTTVQTIGVSFAAQTRAEVAGAVMTRSTGLTGLAMSPTFSTVAGSTVNLGTIIAVQCNVPAVALFQPQAGTETMTGYIGLNFAAMAFGGNVTKIVVNSALAAATNARFLNNAGTAASTFGTSVVHHSDSGVIQFGGTLNAADVSLFWNAAGFFEMFFFSTSDFLQWSSPAADRFLVQANAFGTTSEIEFAFDRFAFGQTGAVGNQVGIFVAPTRTVSIGGDWSDFLLTQAGNITVDAAIGTLAGWTINAPSIMLGTGSVVTGVALNVGGNPNQGTNRIGVRIISNPSGGGGINAALWITVGLSRFDGRVDINNGIALGGGAAATLGTIGGAGPTAAAQAQWVEIDVGGVAHWIPAWT